MTDVVVALGVDNYLGESPIWSAQDKALWWINCEQPADVDCR